MNQYPMKSCITVELLNQILYFHSHKELISVSKLKSTTILFPVKMGSLLPFYINYINVNLIALNSCSA
jgi:hypothetical protein